MNVNIDVNTVLNNILSERMGLLGRALVKSYRRNLAGDTGAPTEDELVVACFVSFIDHASHITDKERIYKFLNHAFVKRGRATFDRRFFDFLVDVEKKVKEFDSKNELQEVDKESRRSGRLHGDSRAV
jgi:hypothetical protein